jgi:hypothetical protein
VNAHAVAGMITNAAIKGSQALMEALDVSWPSSWSLSFSFSFINSRGFSEGDQRILQRGRLTSSWSNWSLVEIMRALA